MTDPVAVFGMRVKELRAMQGLNLRQLEDLSGVSYAQICRIEQGDGTTLRSAIRIADALGAGLAWLLNPSTCTTCLGGPPPGFRCQGCGTDGPRVADPPRVTGADICALPDDVRELLAFMTGDLTVEEYETIAERSQHGNPDEGELTDLALRAARLMEKYRPGR